MAGSMADATDPFCGAIGAVVVSFVPGIGTIIITPIVAQNYSTQSISLPPRKKTISTHCFRK